MKRLLHAIWNAGSSRAMTPVVIGLFFLFYVGVAFFTEETLITLMALTRNSIFLAGLLALIPLNGVLRLLKETGRYLNRRRAMAGRTAEILPELFDEAVDLPVAPAFLELQNRLTSVGYKTRRTENVLTAWRGISVFPARLLFLAGTFCLFTGILISTTSRTSFRGMVIEGEPLPTPEGVGGMVERISLANSSGSILARTLTMVVAPADSRAGKRVYELYPPSLYGGTFVYPRYLGAALHLRFSAPDMQAGYETHCTLNLYPPGKEDAVVIPGSPYRIVISIADQEGGSERYISYMTGKATLRFKILKGKEVVFTGSAPVGGEFARDGYRLALPDIRRLVVTDFIGDYGVFFIWAAGLLFAAAGCTWLALRVFCPRREMLFMAGPAGTSACSRAEGRQRVHEGVFHEALDLVAARQTDTTAAR